jgi:lipopolysaccharide biosynthesis glycosyltransferase
VSRSETLHLACAIERDYAPHCAVMLLSALDHRGDGELHVHLMHPPELPPTEREPIAEMIEREGGRISFLEVPDELVAGFPIEGFTRKATWYRLSVPELLPAVDRALYLDADAIVLDDLTALWQTDIGTALLGAVTNPLQWDHTDRPRRIGMPAGVQYFNAGVLLLDLAQMRLEHTARTIREFTRANAERLEWRDQDALNLVLGSRRHHLHPRWNVMTSVLLYPWAVDAFGAEAVEEARRNPAIRHFEGQTINKPWHYLCDHETRELYFELRRRTPWPRFRPEGRTPANIVRRAIRELRGRPQVPVPEGPGVRP